ncbi:MAG: HigA family addiction module antitoxin [Rhizobiaceae bacterium]
MTSERKSLRHPDLAPIHPGVIIREDVLGGMDMSKADFAAALGISRQMLHGILTQKHPVTVDMAVRLGHVIGNGPDLWINLQRTYDLWHARQRIDVSKLGTLPTTHIAA